MTDHSGRRMLKGFSMLSGASSAATVMSILTNKAIAVIAGTDGIALMGLFRSLGSLVKSGLALGYSTLFMQQISVARSSEEARLTISAAGQLLVLQLLIVIALAGTCSGLLEQWILGPEGGEGRRLIIRVVLLMAFGNLILDTIQAMLKGSGSIPALTWVQIATAGSSLALILPLLKLGDLGLAVNVGSGSVVGAAVGGIWLWRLYRPGFRDLFAKAGTDLLARATGPSLVLCGLAIVLMGTQLGMRSIIGRSWGLAALGHFTAALLIVETMVTLLMSSIRTQLVSALGATAERAEKDALTARMLNLGMVAVALSGAIIILAGGPLLRLLFSDRFEAASALMAVLCLSTFSQAVSWCCHSLFLHRSDVRSLLVLDASWCPIMLCGTAIAARLDWDLASLAWVYVASYAFQAALYLAAALRSFGRGFFGPREAATAAFAAGVLFAGFGTTQLATPATFPVWALATAACIIALLHLSGLKGWFLES
ncbi:MAG: hypothetical protein WC943_15910 [Elusimicrobiota bacterium]